MSTVIDTLLETILGEDVALEVTDPAVQGRRALVFVVGPRAGQPVFLDRTPRPGRGNAPSRLAVMISHPETSAVGSGASEVAVQQVRRVLHRIRTTQQSEAWGVSPIETYMERRFRGKES